MTLTMTPSTTAQQIATRLLESERPLLIAHPRPDGDTAGSALALRLALIALGKSPTVACVDPLNSNLTYLPGAEAMVSDVGQDAAIDLVAAIDMSDLKRTGGIYRDDWRSSIPLVVIDHHETNDAFGDVNLVRPDAAATAFPIIEVINALGVEMTPDMATCLLVAILTDTRGLRTSGTTPEVLRTVSQLIEAGGRYQEVMEKSLNSVPFEQMRAWGIALQRLHLDGELAWTTFPLSEKLAMGIEDHDDLDLGNFISRVAEAQVIVTFIEMRDGTVKISFRSRPNHNVAPIAYELGGGGHRQAAGCSVPGPLDEAVARALSLVRETLYGDA